MTKAAAPIIGGQNCPPVDATASTAAENSFEYPSFFIMGIVIVPVAATFATADPFIIPIKAEARTATFAGPPVVDPIKASEISFTKSEKPLYFKNDPKITNKNM